MWFEQVAPTVGGERYTNLRLEGAVEWPRLGVEALVPELFKIFEAVYLYFVC